MTTSPNLREQADAIRIIIQYLQGFCSTKLYPKFHKTASSSLVQVGWGRTYTGGFPLRPQFINTQMILRRRCNNMPQIWELNHRFIRLVSFRWTCAMFALLCPLWKT